MSTSRASAAGRDSRRSPTTFVTDADAVVIRQRLLKWAKTGYREFPWRKPDKLWHALIAEVLLQRTKASSVVPVYNEFVSRFGTPQALAGATVEEITSVIYPLGLRWRAPLLKKLGEHLALSGEDPPRTIDQLTQLPGVGSYVAAAWLSFHGGRRAVLVDANIVRWICRLVGEKYDGETRRKKWLIELAERLTPAKRSKAYNYAVLDFTMEICTTSPKCHNCPIGPEYCSLGRDRLGLPAHSAAVEA